MSHFRVADYETFDPEPFEKIAHLKRYPHVPPHAHLDAEEQEAVPETVSIPAVKRHLSKDDIARMGGFAAAALSKLDDSVTGVEAVYKPGIVLAQTEELRELFLTHYPTTSPRQVKKLGFSIEKHVAKMNAANNTVVAKLGSIGVFGGKRLPGQDQGRWFLSAVIEDGAKELSAERRGLMNAIIPVRRSRLVARLNRSYKPLVSLLKAGDEASAWKARAALQATEISKSDGWVVFEAAKPLPRDVDRAELAR